MPRPRKNTYSKEKPPFSYVALCAMAIHNSSTGMMTLNEIYRFITNTFPYYKNTSSKWRNSLRHNLSFNDCFVKIVQGTDNGNKRSYWSLHPNCGNMFQEGSLLRRKRRFVNKGRENEDDSETEQSNDFETPENFVNEAAVSQRRLINENDLLEVDDFETVGEKNDYFDFSYLKELPESKSADNRSNPTKTSKTTNFTIENILRGSTCTQKSQNLLNEKVKSGPKTLHIGKVDVRNQELERENRIFHSTCNHDLSWCYCGQNMDPYHACINKRYACDCFDYMGVQTHIPSFPNATTGGCQNRQFASGRERSMFHSGHYCT